MVKKENKKRAAFVLPPKATPFTQECEVNIHSHSLLHLNDFVKPILIFFTIIAVFSITITTIQLFADICVTAKFMPFEYVVKSGDTLWSIAKGYKPDDITMQEYMAWVYEKNGHAGDIYPGDVVIMAEVLK